MAVSNDNTSSSIVINVRQTSVYANVTLYLATDICLPSVPRIGETVTITGAFAGKVENVNYGTFYKSEYREKLHPSYLTTQELPNFNRYMVLLDLVKSCDSFPITSDEMKHSQLDWCHKILASRKERPIDWSRSRLDREGPDYELITLQDVPNYEYFDADAFDETFPEVF